MPKRKLRLLILSFIFFGSTASSALAHDYWIIPDTFHPPENSMVGVAFSSGHSYFGSVETPDITKYRLNLLTPEGWELPLAYSRVDPKAARAMVPVFGHGTYIIGTSSIRPSYWSKTTEGWVPEPKSRAKNVVEGGKYVKSVKTFLTVGNASDSYKRILGYKIEIVPQKNPAALKPGHSLPLLVLYRGRPVRDATVFAVYEGYKPAEKGTYPVNTKTDMNGIARLRLNRPGKWLIGAKYQFDTPGNPNADYENYRAYIMFERKK
ncbi:MAG: DUF4198 domain-containing protein [Deltaproteobacteria bacterium]|nr:DUF4198 domain-containing protein [Deltaproteobacteria bacterium]MBW1933117.1 DUF4198 domain-containing protein [Deltaproteobacteria bacterium]